MNINEEYKKYIDSFPEPKDDIERTLFQYRCVMKFYNKNKKKIKIIIRNIMGYVGTISFGIIYLINTAFICKKKSIVDAIFINADSRESGEYDYSGCFPEELRIEFKNIEYLHLKRFPSLLSGVIESKALRLWLAFVYRFPREGWLNFLCFIHLMSAAKIMKKYEFKALINYRLEFNVASSILTSYYEGCGKELINFMHGDYIVDMRRAFVRFSRCYIFDEHYQKVFLWSRSPKNQFIVYTPPMYRITVDNTFEPQYITYFFSGAEGNLEDVKKILVRLSDKGYKCKVRMHPRYSNIKYIMSVFDNTDICIEDPRSRSIKDSLKETWIAVGRRSTVLLEAYYMGKIVVIDDVSIPEVYNSMRYNMDIMVDKKNSVLSKMEDMLLD